jgi:rhodanese-related sulfurtransferase
MPAREGELVDEIPQSPAAQIAARRRAGEDLFLLDVREPQEVETAAIEGAHWIPLGQIEARIGELIPAKDRPLVVYCHHGNRSQKAVRLLRERGFSRAENLDGGIEAWSLTVDPSIPRY